MIEDPARRKHRSFVGKAESSTLSGKGSICNKMDHEAMLREKNRRRRTVQGNKADTARQKSTSVNRQYAQTVEMQSI